MGSSPDAKPSHNVLLLTLLPQRLILHACLFYPTCIEFNLAERITPSPSPPTSPFFSRHSPRNTSFGGFLLFPIARAIASLSSPQQLSSSSSPHGVSPQCCIQRHSPPLSLSKRWQFNAHAAEMTRQQFLMHSRAVAVSGHGAQHIERWIRQG